MKRAHIKTVASIICAFSMCMAIASPGAAHETQSEFEDRLRTYLMENPEVILEALEVLSAREAAAQTEQKIAQFPDLFTRPPILGMGGDEASLRVIEFFDYKCVPCRAVHETLETLTENTAKLRIEMRQLPILTPGSERATRFAFATLETYDVETYHRVHDALWAHKGPYGTVTFARMSEELELDFDEIEPAMWSDAVSQRIETNRNMAMSLDIIGTPAFVTKRAVSIGETDPELLSELFFNQ